jgi:hypothetical protein
VLVVHFRVEDKFGFRRVDFPLANGGALTSPAHPKKLEKPI